MADGRHVENRYIISAKNHQIFILLQCDTENSVNIVANEKVALDRLRVRQNVFLVLCKKSNFNY